MSKKITTEKYTAVRRNRDVFDPRMQLSFGAIGLWVYLDSLGDEGTTTDNLAARREGTTPYNIIGYITELALAGYLRTVEDES